MSFALSLKGSLLLYFLFYATRCFFLQARINFLFDWHTNRLCVLSLVRGEKKLESLKGYNSKTALNTVVFNARVFKVSIVMCITQFPVQ